MPKHGYRILDSDIHVMEPPDMFDRYLDPRMRVHTGAGQFFDLVTEPPDAGSPEFEANRQKMLRAQAVLGARVQDHYVEERMRGYTAELLLEAMDKEGVDVALLFRSRSHMYVDRDDLDAEYATAICRAYNDWLADFATAEPTRLLPSAIVTLHDPDLAAREARRAVGELGMKAVTLLPHPVRGRYLHDPDVDVLWSALQELDVAATFHSQSGGYAVESPGNWFRDHPNPTVLSHAFTAPLNIMWAIGSVILGGVLERFPSLRMGFLEGNCAWLPWLLWRLDEQWELFEDAEEISLSLKPSEYFLRQCYIAVDPGEALVSQVIDDIGDDNIVISTDYPHLDSLYPEAMKTFIDLPNVSEQSKRKILWDNCARLYNVGG